MALSVISSSTVPISERQLLVHFELNEFKNIPRTLVLLQVETLRGFRGEFDAEFILINPDFLASTSSDRFILPFLPDANDLIDGMPSSRMNEKIYRKVNHSLEKLVPEAVKVHKVIKTLVRAANQRLHDLQEEIFGHRAVLIKQGRWDPTHPHQGINEEAPFGRLIIHELRKLRRIFDRRSYLSQRLLLKARERKCVEFAMAMRKHASNRGVPGLPPFWVDRDCCGLHYYLSAEEKLWLENPTLEWIPSQSQVRTSFRVTKDFGSPYDNGTALYVTQKYSTSTVPNEEKPFSLPDYQQYAQVHPVDSQRLMTCRDTLFTAALFPWIPEDLSIPGPEENIDVD